MNVLLSFLTFSHNVINASVWSRVGLGTVVVYVCKH